MELHNIIYQKVSRETFDSTFELFDKHEEQLEKYLDQLLWWNKRINLVSRDVPRETIRKHVQHSLILSEFDVFKKEDVFVDTGTGGGLPGIPLAITHPEKHFVLNDLVTKKCLAIKQIAKKLNLKNIGIFDRSIDNLSYNAPFHLISKHAFKINELIKMTHHLPWKKMILYKGLDFESELYDIDINLEINCYDLSSISDFYNGKAILSISPLQ